MKKIIKVLSLIFIGFGLVQLIDLSFYLMNRSDGYLFNLGVLTFGVIFVVFILLGVKLLEIVNPEVKEEVKQEKEE